ncbi:MAG: radical SAM protein [Candidatus Helarchaeota archaeon]
MYDPLVITPRIETRLIQKNFARKYWRFRGAKYYGGISTGDVVGCNMNCPFCWVHPKIRHQVQTVGTFYTPEHAGQKLVKIAQNAHFSLIRLSGGEPTIGKDHLILLLQYLTDFPFRFILETNGMLLSDDSYTKQLKFFEFLHVRVALKAPSPEIFSKITGAVPTAFYYPLQALKNLIKYRISCHAAIIADFCSENNLKFLIKELQAISPRLVNELEYEFLILYPHVKKGLKKVGFEF